MATYANPSNSPARMVAQALANAALANAAQQRISRHEPTMSFERARNAMQRAPIDVRTWARGIVDACLQARTLERIRYGARKIVPEVYRALYQRLGPAPSLDVRGPERQGNVLGRRAAAGRATVHVVGRQPQPLRLPGRFGA